MDSDKQSDMEEVRRTAHENRKTIERLRENVRTLKAKLEKPDADNCADQTEE